MYDVHCTYSLTWKSENDILLRNPPKGYTVYSSVYCNPAQIGFCYRIFSFKNEANRFQGGAGKKRSILTKTHSYYTIPWVSFRERVCERCEACDAVWEYSSSVRAISSLVNHLIARVGSAPNFFHENILSQKVHEFDFIFFMETNIFCCEKKINI